MKSNTDLNLNLKKRHGRNIETAIFKFVFWANILKLDTCLINCGSEGRSI